MRIRSWRALLVAGAVGTVLVASPASAAGPAYVDDAARALATGPLYVSPTAGTLAVDTPTLTSALAASSDEVALALLPAAAAQAGEGGDPATLPSLISARGTKATTVVVVVGRRLYAASTTLAPDRLSAALADATPLLAPSSLSAGAATAALQDLAGRLTGGSGGGVADPQGPSRAGSPGGLVVALALLGGGVVAGVVIALRMRRRKRGPRPPGRLASWWARVRPPPAPPAPPRTRVEVDARGRITNITRATTPRPGAPKS